MRYPAIPIKGRLYLVIERHVPGGPLPIGPYTGNAFIGTLQEARGYKDQLNALSQREAATCIRCEKATAWWVVEATTLEVAGIPGGDLWAKSGPVCKCCYDELVAEAWVLSNSLEIVSWLKKAIRRGLGEHESALLVGAGVVAGWVLALLLR